MNDKNNKLIALFMGLKEDGVDGYLVDMDKDYGYQIVHESCFLYDSEWGWLMPVVKKCKESQIFGTQNLIDDIDSALVNVSLSYTYQAVVEFIKKYNDER